MACKWNVVAAAALVLLLSVAGMRAAELKIGDKPPRWAGIVGTDGKDHSLSDYKEAKLIVTAFTCNHCPGAKA